MRLRYVMAIVILCGCIHGALGTSQSFGQDQNDGILPAASRGVIAVGPNGVSGFNPNQNPGGGAQADFDSLIELIESTVAPDTWDTVGGDGSMQGFPGGVYVNAAGILKQIDATTSKKLAARWKASQSDRPATSDDANVSQASRLRKVSLVELWKAYARRAEQKLPPTEAMKYLAGLSRVDFVVIDRKRQDIILAGPAAGWKRDAWGRLVSSTSGRPVLHLDDWVVLWRNAHTKNAQYLCAITPTRDGLQQAQQFVAEQSQTPIPVDGRDAYLEGLRESLGMQQIDVQGINPSTRVARVIVEADHHMKQIGIGLAESVDGVPSYLDQLAETGAPPASMDVLRWWFTLQPGCVVRCDGDQVYGMLPQTVRVLSENEFLDEQGGRHATGRSQPLNHRFAEDFTLNFKHLARKYSIYADLDNVFRLSLAAALIRDKTERTALDGVLDVWLEGEYPVEMARTAKWTPSIVNDVDLEKGRFVAAVSGGVKFDGRGLAFDSTDAPAWFPQRTSVDFSPERRTSDDAGPGTDQLVWWWD